MADFDEAETDWFADIEQAISGSDATGHLYDPQQPSTSAAFYESAAGVSATIDFTSLADVPIDEATYYEFREFIADERQPHTTAGSSQECAMAEMAPTGMSGPDELQAVPPYTHQHQLPPPMPGEGQPSVAAAGELGPPQSREGGNWPVSDQPPVLMDMKPMMRPPPSHPAQPSYDVEGTDAAYHSYHQYHPASSAQLPPSDYINLDHQPQYSTLSASANNPKVIDMSQVPPDPVTRSNKNKRARPSRPRGPPRQRSAPKSAPEEEESPTFSLDAVISRLFSASGEAAIRFTAEMNAEFASCVQQYKELEAKQFTTGIDYTPRLRNIEKRIAALVSAAEPATATPPQQAPISISQKSTPRKRPGARPLPTTASSSLPTMQAPQQISTPIPSLTIGPGGQLQFFSSQAPGGVASGALNGGTSSSLQGQTVVVDYGQGPQVMTMVATAPSIPLEQLSTFLPTPTYSAAPGGARKSRAKAAKKAVNQPPQPLPATPQFIVIGSSAGAPSTTVPMMMDVAEPTPPSARAKAQRRARPRPTTSTRDSSKALAILMSSPPPPPLKRVVPTVGELTERVATRRDECRHLLDAKFDTIRQSMARTDYQTPFTDRHDPLQRLLPYAFLLEPDLGDEVLEAFDHQFLRHSLSMEARWRDCDERMRKLLYSDAMGTASNEELNMLLQLDAEWERRELSGTTAEAPYQPQPTTASTSSSLATHFPNFEYHEWCPEVYYKAAANYGYHDFPLTPTDEWTLMGRERAEQDLGVDDLKAAVSPQSPGICMGGELEANVQLIGTPETASAMDYGIEESDKDEPEQDEAESLNHRSETPPSPLLPPPPPPPPTGGLKLKIRLPPPQQPSPAPDVQAEEDAESVSERRLAKLERRRKRKEEKRRSREHVADSQGQCPSPNSESLVKSHRLPTPCWSSPDSKLQTTAFATSTSAASPTSSSGVVGARREAKGLKLFVPKFLLSRPLPPSDSPSPSSSSTSGGGVGRGRRSKLMMSRATPSPRFKVNATPRTRKDPPKLAQEANGKEAPVAAAKVVPKLRIRIGPKRMTEPTNGEAERIGGDGVCETPAAGSSISSNPASNQTLTGVAGMETSPLGLAHINAIQANLMQSVMACGRGLSPPSPYGAAISSAQSGANPALLTTPSSSKHPTTAEKSHVQFSPCASDDSDDERLRAETIHLLTKLQ